MWAIPKNKELPPPWECTFFDQKIIPSDFPLLGPKPEFALEDTMEAIEGDKHPLSYLQAALVAIEFGEFGAYRHGCSGQVLLPVENPEQDWRGWPNWEMLEPKPATWDPRFFYGGEGTPTLVIYVWSYLVHHVILEVTYRFSRPLYLTIEKKSLQSLIH